MMNEKRDQTTTIALTFEVRDMVKGLKIVPEESYNNAIRRFLIDNGVNPE